MLGILIALSMFMSPEALPKVMTFNVETIVVSQKCEPACVSRAAQVAIKNVIAIHFRPQTIRPDYH